MTVPDSRRFGFMFAVVFAVLALWRRHDAMLPWLLSALAAATLAVAALRPAVLESPARLWLRFGGLLHRIVSPVVLGAMYLLLIVPTGLLRRALLGDPLHRRFEPGLKTYWVECEPRGRTLDDFRQPF